jgi:beta-phosphoglucomutase
MVLSKGSGLGIEAVIFDLDGVLVDTEAMQFGIWQDMVCPYGEYLDRSDYLAMVGIDAIQTAEYVVSRCGIERQPEEFEEEHRMRLREALEAGVTPFPGAAELARRLTHAGFRLGVATNSSFAYAGKVLQVSRLMDHFPVIITRDQVQSGKPAPDVYLAAAAGLNCPPQVCLAIEDSLTGLKAALSAGMRTVLISRETPPEGLNPWMRCNSLVDLVDSLFGWPNQTLFD